MRMRPFTFKREAKWMMLLNGWPILVLVAWLIPACWSRAHAQPQLTLNDTAIAQRIVAQLALKPGERVIALAHPGTFAELATHIRYEVMRAGAVDLGVVEVLREPWPASFELPVLIRGARASRGSYKAMFRDVDAAIMMPGATTSH